MKYLKLLPQYWKTISVLVIILFLCLLPGNDVNKIDFLNFTYEDKVVHLMMFLGFSSALFYDLKRNTELANKMATLTFTVVAFCVLLGITTEMLQALLTSLNRDGSITDFLFDLIGSGLGITWMRFIRR
jgi:VanZ family protein